MDLLPPESVRSTLLDALALLIERQGYETFVRAPILEPTSRFFPDPWEPTERGVRALSLRLLAYAGLEDLDASVEIDSGEYHRRSSRVGSYRHEGAAAWFWGIHDGTCVFGADRRELDESDAIVGTMCHEVAHAYRRHHDLESTTRQIDEEQTDITTIYLGFGVLTVNNAHRYRTRLEQRAMQWSTTQTGYLSLQAMAYLFAAQCVARGLPATTMSRLGRLLEANQRESFEAARRGLGADPEGLRVRLGVPPEETWPPEEPFELIELRDDALFEPVDPAALQRAEHARRNLGRPVWRIASTRGAWLGFSGGLTASVLAGALASHFGWSVGGMAAGAAAFGAIAGGLLGQRFVRYQCSDAGCGGTPGRDVVERCSRCGGTFVGTIDDERDRLEAEETLAAGRSLDELRATVAARRAKGARQTIAVLGIVGLVATGLAVVGALPQRVSIASVTSDNPELRRARLRLTGYVVESRVGTESLVNDEGAELLPFRLSDETGRILVWYEPSTVSPTLREGDHVTATGQQFLVDTGISKKVRFIASEVRREQ